MIIYRGHEVKESFLGSNVFHVITQRPVLGKVVIGGFQTPVAAFRFIDDLLADSVHPWRTDFRELVRLMQGRIALPHGFSFTGGVFSGGCEHCADANKLATEAYVNAHS